MDLLDGLLTVCFLQRTWGWHWNNYSAGHVATVFGCTGFLGRYLVHKLGAEGFFFRRTGDWIPDDTVAKEGTMVIVPYREEDAKRHLKVMGDLGQVVSLVIELLLQLLLTWLTDI